MTTKASTGLRNHMLATGSLKAALDGGFLELYQGPEPATADAPIDPAQHKLLVRIYSDGTSAGLTLSPTAADGFIEKSTQTWSGTNIDTGTVQFFRFVGPSDSGALSTTLARLQGTVARAGADLNITSVELTAGAPQAVNFFSIALPAF
ncbi:hypothetical protein CLV01_3375 [Delftia sp. 60]|uniref:hypothetical protein n=1 Tax=Delftia sp. 60 TaxID=2035216 RepID=UPI000C5D3426|nr:hypothetical protein [Delftia sp. 60]PIF37847.1 hypothetical protein CLU98_3075 [Burkholderiales bacterium 23]PIF66973.1 hypothetical protein CLV01_3375 [Delftia sp. 60]